jgi:hypothetical protein
VYTTADQTDAPASDRPTTLNSVGSSGLYHFIPTEHKPSQQHAKNKFSHKERNQESKKNIQKPFLKLNLLTTPLTHQRGK